MSNAVKFLIIRIECRFPKKKKKKVEMSTYNIVRGVSAEDNP